MYRSMYTSSFPGAIPLLRADIHMQRRCMVFGVKRAESPPESNKQEEAPRFYVLYTKDPAYQAKDGSKMPSVFTARIQVPLELLDPQGRKCCRCCVDHSLTLRHAGPSRDMIHDEDSIANIINIEKIVQR